MLSNGSDLLIGGGEEVTNTPLMQMPDFGGYGTAKTAAPTGYGAPSPGPSQLQQPVCVFSPLSTLWLAFLWHSTF